MRQLSGGHDHEALVRLVCVVLSELDELQHGN